MTQITIYLEEALANRMRQAAQAAGRSQSRWLASLIEEKLRNEWPPSVAALAGAWVDFPEAEELRQGLGEDIAREPV